MGSNLMLQLTYSPMVSTGTGDVTTDYDLVQVRHGGGRHVVSDGGDDLMLTPGDDDTGHIYDVISGVSGVRLEFTGQVQCVCQEGCDVVCGGDECH